MTLTPDELAALRAEFGEGIPPWMLEPDRKLSADAIRELMALRRKAFPNTHPQHRS